MIRSKLVKRFSDKFEGNSYNIDVSSSARGLLYRGYFYEVPKFKGTRIRAEDFPAERFHKLNQDFNRAYAGQWLIDTTDHVWYSARKNQWTDIKYILPDIYKKTLARIYTLDNRYIVWFGQYLTPLDGNPIPHVFMEWMKVFPGEDLGANVPIEAKLEKLKTTVEDPTFLWAITDFMGGMKVPEALKAYAVEHISKFEKDKLLTESQIRNLVEHGGIS